HVTAGAAQQERADLVEDGLKEGFGKVEEVHGRGVRMGCRSFIGILSILQEIFHGNRLRGRGGQERRTTEKPGGSPSAERRLAIISSDCRSWFHGPSALWRMMPRFRILRIVTNELYL